MLIALKYKFHLNLTTVFCRAFIIKSVNKIRPHHLETNNCNFHKNEKSFDVDRVEILERNEKLM